MPLLFYTKYKINKFISTSQDKSIDSSIKNGFKLLIEQYSSQIFSRKIHKELLLAMQNKINTLNNSRQIITILKKLEHQLKSKNSSFALQSLKTLIAASEKIIASKLPPTQVAATSIQNFYRTFKAKQKYKIKHLDSTKKKEFRTYVVGNDPIIQGIEQYAQPNTDHTPIAVVGVSGLRSLEIALRLSNLKSIPKVIIVDNSKYVGAFWIKLRQFAISSSNEKDFFATLPKFLRDNSHLYAGSNGKIAGYPNQNITEYLHELCDKFGFKRVRDTLCAVSMIQQSWEDKNCILKIKNVLSFLGIKRVYAYASNVVSYMEYRVDRQAAMNILKNIQLLNPILAIHTDISPGSYPKKVFLVEDHTPEAVISKLATPKRYSDIQLLAAILFGSLNFSNKSLTENSSASSFSSFNFTAP